MLDLGAIIAIVGSAMAIIAVIVMLMLWVRSEANADRRDIVSLIIAIKDEIKDFHERLIKIEEKRK
jgi:Ca2+/Na+ antiporter